MTQRIAPLTERNAPAETQPQLAGLGKALGMVPNLFATIGHSPQALRALLSWDASLIKNGLSKREIEMLNLRVSELNTCGYCLSAHTAISQGAGLSPAEIEGARNGVGTTARESAMLALATRVVRTGGGRAGTEFVRAKEAGLSDAEIVDVLAVVALKTFTNAVALVADTEIDFPRASQLPSP